MASINQDASDSIAALSKEVDSAAAKIEAQQKGVLQQMEQMETLQQQIQQGNKENIMLALGSGYFVERTRSEALEFLQRQVTSLRNASEDLEQRLNKVKETKTQLVTFSQVASQTPLDEDKLNEEGLPFMDIVEQLDADDNVISAQVNNRDVDPILQAEDVASSADLIEPFVDDAPDISTPVADLMDVDGDDTPHGPKIRELGREDMVSESNKSSKQTVDGDVTDTADVKDDGAGKDTDSHEKGRLSRQFSELLEDMELVSAPVTRENLLSRINSLDIDSEHKQQLLEAYHRQFDKFDDEMTDVREPEVQASADDTFDESTQREREQVLADIIKENIPEDSSNTKELHGNTDPTILARPSVDTSDLLELEILADDFNGDEDEWDGDWPFDEDEDDEDDDIEDMLSQPQFFKGNTPANDMLWKQVLERRQNLSMPKIDKSDTGDQGSSLPIQKKSVRFAPELDIKEVENISDDLKNMNVAPKVSLFKQRRLQDDLVTDSPSAESEVVDEEMSDGNVLEESVIERFDNNSIDDLAKSTILERPQETPLEKPKKVSRFKQQRQTIPDSSTNSPFLKQSAEDNSSSSLDDHNRASADNDSQESKISPSLKEIDAGNNNQKIVLDYHSIQNDLDLMAKAYASGLYDDDINNKGPVVEEPHDFELINDMVESMAQDTPSTTTRRKPDPQFDARSDEVGDFDFPDIESADEDNFPILADEIVEHETNALTEDPEDSILQSEISSNYHRLRQKFLFDQNGFRKSQQELEMEPIDAEGNPIKVSRFKAARLGKA
ncbi:hypothetical protein DIURU_003487 [Diutina rugosa]|uniref:DUF3835 domain-containing protein n=1 Tax=Diutina rugosa TaxID=5481 RepID=A0A642UL90_DIURU|nr:uncharacterized protein DIURU_003487 [Diutina rugosa]KAA8901117.1 hypothetical protein DIURU_003487 [Diutina rugosa]